mgnify:CR=1 FL=1
MKSGLEGRNNNDRAEADLVLERLMVSMKSGLEGRNNRTARYGTRTTRQSQ